MQLTKELTFVSDGDFYALNITDQVQDVLDESGIHEGMALVFCRHATGALLIIEHETGILVDLENILERVIPVQAEYKHHLRGYDKNGAAHLRTALLGVSVTVPVVAGKLALGEYQEIIMIDLDIMTKTRSVIVQVMGE